MSKSTTIKAIPTHLDEADCRSIAAMVVASVDNSTILECFDITEKQLDALKADPMFRVLAGGAKQVTVKEQISREIDWDDLESAALKRTMDTLGDTESPEASARIAAIANKAKRRIADNVPSRTIDNNSPANAYRDGVILDDARFQQMKATFQKLFEREAAIITNAPTKQSDVCSVADIEDFLKDG